MFLRYLRVGGELDAINWKCSQQYLKEGRPGLMFNCVPFVRYLKPVVLELDQKVAENSHWITNARCLLRSQTRGKRFYWDRKLCVSFPIRCNQSVKVINGKFCKSVQMCINNTCNSDYSEIHSPIHVLILVPFLNQ